MHTSYQAWDRSWIQSRFYCGELMLFLPKNMSQELQHQFAKIGSSTSCWQPRYSFEGRHEVWLSCQWTPRIRDTASTQVNREEVWMWWSDGFFQEQGDWQRGNPIQDWTPLLDSTAQGYLGNYDGKTGIAIPHLQQQDMSRPLQIQWLGAFGLSPLSPGWFTDCCTLKR